MTQAGAEKPTPRPRVWFKKDMKAAILEGRKRGTTRDHPLKLETFYNAVSGSRYDAEIFAVIKVVGRHPTKLSHVFFDHFKDEGFESPSQMEEWAKKNGLLKDAPEWFYHEFIPYDLDGQEIRRRA